MGWLKKYQEGGTIKAQGGKSFEDITGVKPIKSVSQQSEKQPINKVDAQLIRDLAPNQYENKGSLKSISKKDFNKAASFKDVLLNPMTALKYKVQGQNIPANFTRGERNPLDYAIDAVNPVMYANAAGNTVGNLAHPINTLSTLGKAGTNLLTNMTDGQNAFDDGSNEKALGILGDVAIAGSIKGTLKNASNIYDKQFNSIGRKLEDIRYQGEAAGLNPYNIASKQMNQVGITSNQREAYVPFVSDFLHSKVTPFGYGGYDAPNKLIETIKNVKGKGVDIDTNSARYLRRDDAFALYLGIPQKNKTFRMSNTSPVNHPSYSGKQLQNKDIYKLNYEKTLKPPNYDTKELIEEISVKGGDDVMGGYNTRFTNDGYQYNDIWDLDPDISVRSVIPRAIRKHMNEDSNLFMKANEDGSRSLRGVKINTDQFIGKPFMSHGDIQFTWDTHKNNILREITDTKKIYKKYKNPRMENKLTETFNRISSMEKPSWLQNY